MAKIMTKVIDKEQAANLVGLQSVEELNQGLGVYVEALRSQGLQIPAELEDLNGSTISKDTLSSYRDFVTQTMTNRSLGESKPEEPKELANVPQEQPAVQIEQFSQQVLSGARDSLAQLHSTAAYVDGMAIADDAWNQLLFGIADRTEERFNQLSANLTANLQQRLQAMQLRQSQTASTQQARLVEMNNSSQRFLSQAQEAMNQAKALPM